ncbi:MAG: ChbG/HpnK family deacetylase [Planctomycetota bacterium]
MFHDVHSRVKSIRLAVRADDFGLHRACDAVMLGLVRAGVLQNVSVQANGPDLTQSAGELAASGACVGLHLCFTCEWRNVAVSSVSERERVPNLMRHGRLPATATQLEHVDVGELLVEADAQLERLQAFGLRPAYADTHMGVHHTHAGLNQRIRGWARDAGLRWIDDTPRLRHLRHPTGKPSWAGLATGTYLLVLHPGDATANLVLDADPTRAIGRQRADEATLLRNVVTAARSDERVQLCRLDDPVADFCTHV